MSQTTVVDLDEVLINADRLLESHTKRNPQAGLLNECSREIQRLSVDGLRAPSQMRLARIAFVLGDTVGAVEHLIAGVVDGGEAEAAAKANFAVEIAQSVGGRRPRDAHPLPSDVKGLFSKLTAITAPISTLASQRVQMFSMMASKRPLKALKIAIDLVNDDPDALGDASYILQRIYAGAYSEGNATEVHQLIKGVEDERSRTSLEDACFQLENDALARASRTGAEIGPDPQAVTSFLAERGVEGARALVRAKDLFLSVYPHDEEIKFKILRGFKEFVADRGSGSAAKRLVEISSQTARFWHDDDFRNEIIDCAAVACDGDDSGEANFVQGILAYLQDDMVLANKWFAASVPLSKQLALTGATSFFVDLNENDETPFLTVETDFSQVGRVANAYVCCADEKYFAKHAKAYAASARAHGQSARLHFHIAGSSPDSAYQLFREHLSGVENVSVSWERPALAIPTYYASMRFLRIEDFLSHVADRVVLTDIDVEFRSSPDAFIERQEFDDADVGFRIYDKVRIVRQATGGRGRIYRYPRILPWSIVNAACLVIKSTDAGRQVAMRVATDMRRHLGRALAERESAWWIDQNSLFMTMKSVATAGEAKVVSLEDIGIPFGSFDYSSVSSLPGRHPAIPAIASV